MAIRFAFALLASGVVTAAPCFSAELEEGFVPLFDGESIDGWVQRGGKAVYTVENGEIVGTSVANTPNSFLCTPRNYADFVLLVELKVDSGLNSGIQIRSECFDKAFVAKAELPGGKAFRRRIPAGRVHGYQVEIDPSERSYSGGIYDEARRGWLYDLRGDANQAAREAFRRDDWNEYRIEAVGDSLRTWVNGVPAAELTDGMTSTGFIALQVHGIRSKDQVGKQVRWRNLRIQEK
ncbi:MAG: DUF1080 domain-containing protein [Planctomycetota bacterium]